MIETINGVATTTKVAIFTEAVKATGNSPNPALLGASVFVPKETKYKTNSRTETPNPTNESGNKNSVS